MRVEKEYKFEAAHILPRHKGKCSNLHGHSWRVSLEIHGPVNKETGFVVDFGDIDDYIMPVINRFDHKLLNCFVRYPSSENIAIHIAHDVRARIPYPFRSDVDRLVVRVSETQKTWAVFDTNDTADLYSLDNAAADAEWRSPDIGIKTGDDMSVAIGNAKAMLPDLQKKYIDALTVLEQLKLFIDSMDDNPVLPDFKEYK